MPRIGKATPMPLARAARRRRSGTFLSGERTALFMRARFSRRVFLVGGVLGLVHRKPVVERLQADAEHVGRLALGTAFGERRLDQAPAHFVERAADAHGED